MTSTSAGSVGPGTVLAGRYRLEDLLTEHSGAWFWRATDTVLARDVAVHAVGSHDERAPRLLDAAQLSATVNDPHLLRVLDCSEEDGVCWVVHEWGEGISLDLMLERGPLAPARAAWLAKEVAEAVAAGHAQGVTHGWLNPEAVLVTHSGAVKLIGYVVDAALHAPRAVDPVYGELDDREADVIDVAGVLYAALTGRWPGVSGSAVPEAPADARGPLRPRQVRAGVPRALDAICERVLHRAGSRHELPIESAHELAAALADLTGVGARPGAVTLAGTGEADDPDEGPTAVISRAALAEEAQRRTPEAVADSPADSPADAAGPGTCDDRVDTGDLEATQATAAISPTSWPSVHEPVPEPPPYQESPDRPLFATTERRVPAGSRRSEPAPGHTGRTATVAGSAGHTVVSEPPRGPAFWAEERDADPAPPTEDRHEGRGWLRTAVVVGVVLAVLIAMITAFSIGRGSDLPLLGGANSSSSEAPAAAATPLRVQAVSDFDPQGDGEERPEDVGNVLDGDPATSWSTVTYYNRADLGGLKDGVGLVLDLGSDREVGSLAVRFARPGTSFEVYAAPQGVTEAPTSTDGMELVGAAEDAADQASVDLDPRPTTRFVLLWLTSLPAAPDGFQGEVVDVSLRP